MSDCNNDNEATSRDDEIVSVKNGSFEPTRELNRLSDKCLLEKRIEEQSLSCDARVEYVSERKNNQDQSTECEKTVENNKEGQKKPVINDMNMGDKNKMKVSNIPCCCSS